MTEQLYLVDSYILSCDAIITDIVFDRETVFVAFDKTPFFPGGGGQPADSGFVNEFEIFDAFEKNGIIYHRIQNKDFSYKIGNKVNLSVNEAIRIERMRAHTGEHIISGIAHNLFGVRNVGFHMDENGIMTVDFDKYLEKNDLQNLELEANRCVMSNKNITANTYSVSDVSVMDFRSKIDFTDNVRIVEIEDTDKCACCAPHLRTTGEVGCIKILSSASHRGGIRISLICGEKAYLEFVKRYRQILNVSSLLCAKYDDADKAVEQLIENNKSLKFEKECLKKDFLDFAASDIKPSDIILEFFDSFTIDDLRIINNNLKSKCTYISMLFSGNDSDGYCYCIYSEKLKLDKFVKDMNSALNGSGGGRGVLIQGKLKSSASDIKDFVKEMKVTEYENA